MKKKVVVIACGVVIVAAIAAMLIFAFGGKNDVPAVTVNMEGTWKVVSYINNGNATIVDSEYMVFTADSVRDYRDGEAEPFVTSKYTIDKNLLLQLTDISRKYTVEKRTENHIRLYESNEIYMELIRYQNADMSELDVDTNILNGKWNVVYRNTATVYAGEYLLFENGMISRYSAGASESVATSNFTWENGNHLICEAWGKDMVLYPISKDTVILVEINTDVGYVWELQKAE